MHTSTMKMVLQFSIDSHDAVSTLLHHLYHSPPSPVTCFPGTCQRGSTEPAHHVLNHLLHSRARIHSFQAKRTINRGDHTNKLELSRTRTVAATVYMPSVRCTKGRDITA